MLPARQIERWRWTLQRSSENPSQYQFVHSKFSIASVLKKLGSDEQVRESVFWRELLFRTWGAVSVIFISFLTFVFPTLLHDSSFPEAFPDESSPISVISMGILFE